MYNWNYPLNQNTENIYHAQMSPGAPLPPHPSLQTTIDLLSVTTDVLAFLELNINGTIQYVFFGGGGGGRR